MSTLDEEELKGLLPFLKSPFFNSNPSIVKLYRLLRKYHPDFSSRQLNKEFIFKKIFPERAFDYNKLHNLFSDFTRLLEKYLSVLELQKNKIEERKMLIQSYMDRDGAYHLFEKEIHRLDQYIEQLLFRDERYFYEKEWLNLCQYGHQGNTKRKAADDTFEKAHFYFNEYIKVKKVKMKCAENERNKTMNMPHENKINAVENPVLELYCNLELLQNNSDDIGLVEKISKDFIAKIHHLRLTDRNNMIKILQNYCARKINRGVVEMGPISLELYQVGLMSECLLINDKMTEATFQNIISTAIFCNQLDWAKSFMDDYKNKMNEEHREDTLAIGMAQWHFSKREYQECIQVMQRNFKESQNQFKAKSILVRTWFELFCLDKSYFEILILQLEAFEKFTRRNKSIHARLAEAYLHFISLVRKIAQHKLEGKNLKKLMKEVQNESVLVLRNWLLEKVS